jgi:hypothetical protein
MEDQMNVTLGFYVSAQLDGITFNYVLDSETNIRPQIKTLIDRIPVISENVMFTALQTVSNIENKDVFEFMSRWVDILEHDNEWEFLKSFLGPLLNFEISYNSSLKKLLFCKHYKVLPTILVSPENL